MGEFSLGNFLHYLFVDLADPRTLKWPMMYYPTQVIAIVLIYIFFVKLWGPRLMANRKPFKMQKTLIVYNLLHVLFSGYLAYDTIFNAYIFGDYSVKCQPVDWTRSEAGMYAARGCYWYFLAKISELMDTVFFVLRKKDSQISFLHVFHHSGMVFMSFGVVKYYPGGNIVFYGMLNSVVHTIMYLYYMLAAMGPEWQKFLWWKKYITRIQMLQFTLAFIHGAQMFYTDCGFPRWTLLVLLPNAIFFFFLFNDFYQQAYKKEHQFEKQKEKQLNRGKTNHFMNGNTSDTANLMVHRDGHCREYEKKII